VKNHFIQNEQYNLLCLSVKKFPSTLKTQTMNWSDAVTQIKAWQLTHPNQPKCFLITAADIASINAQLTGGMSALKMYLGQDANGTVSAFFIGCVADGSGSYDDCNMPGNQSVWNSALGANALPVKKDGLPCPTHCGSTNVLNS
jgi:hypothetical protein